MFFWVLVVASVISFLGSLQLGPVNLYVINTTLAKGKSAALLCALGGSLPEFMYCGAAVYAGDLLLDNPIFNLILNYTFAALLVIVGLVFYFKAPMQVDFKEPENLTKQAVVYISKGFTLAVLNPQLLPFWLLVRGYLNSNSIVSIQTAPQKLAFILGAGVGAFLLLFFFVMMVEKYRQTIFMWINNRNYFKVLSFLFFGLALYQTWKLFFLN